MSIRSYRIARSSSDFEQPMRASVVEVLSRLRLANQILLASGHIRLNPGTPDYMYSLESRDGSSRVASLCAVVHYTTVLDTPNTSRRGVSLQSQLPDVRPCANEGGWSEARGRTHPAIRLNNHVPLCQPHVSTCCGDSADSPRKLPALFSETIIRHFA